ncbi:MAG: prepilin-type N-terminal cleavage/methylation domain-containing protein [Patescibacteria group bacterium]
MHRATRHSASAGVTLMELLMVIAILLVLFALTTRTFQGVNSGKAIDTEALRIVTELNEARSLTLSSKYAKPFGVHFDSSSVTLFEGATYSAGSATNTTALLNSLVQVSSIDLAGGGSDVVFQRLTGKTAHSGTITLSLLSNASTSKIITIYATGLVDAQ